MSSKTEAITDVLADMKEAGLERWANHFERALSAQSAQIIAWSRDGIIYDDNGCPIGTDETEIRWQSECPDPEGRGAPLYGGPYIQLSLHGEAMTGARCADCRWAGEWPKTDAGRRGACPVCDEGALVD